MPTATTTKEDSRSKLVQNHPHDFTKKQKYETAGLDEDAQAAELLQEFESRSQRWSAWSADRLWKSSF